MSQNEVTKKRRPKDENDGNDGGRRGEIRTVTR